MPDQRDEATTAPEAEPLDPLEIAIDVSVDVDIVANAHRRHGALGAIVAAGMWGIDQALGRKPREEVPVVVSAPSDPLDIDTDGITVALDGVAVTTPALPRTAPKVAPARRRRR
jgi:hypothetical protein